MIIDNHGREINYMRIAVTDKCNLRCFYCMPEEGIKFVKKDELLSYEEMLRVCSILAREGVSKIRITGGEPLLRKGIIDFLSQLSLIEGINKIALTTNGTLTGKYIDELLGMGIDSINLSIDSIDKERFFDITRRDVFDEVWGCYKMLLNKNIDLKLNCVVMGDRNIEDIIPLVELGSTSDVSIRFIEEMPFNGVGKENTILEWNHVKILEHISAKYNNITKLPDPKASTSFNYQVDGFKGSFGIIPAYTRSFCGSCNRLRLTPTGLIKTCLYDSGVFNLRDIIRAGANDLQILSAIKNAISHRAKDGHEAELNRGANHHVSESMATIGG